MWAYIDQPPVVFLQFREQTRAVELAWALR